MSARTVVPRPAHAVECPAHRRYTELTPRLAEVLPLLADGLDDKQIAERLGITAGSVRSLAQRLVLLYSASNRWHMVACAFRQGDVS